MTRDEIMALEAGPEINALIAREIMGWRKKHYWLGPAWVRKTTWKFKDGRTKDMWTLAKYVKNWLPSTDIALAWEVIEKMQDKRLPSIFHDGQLWVCGLTDLRNPFIASANTAPLAICRATLLTEVKR